MDELDGTALREPDGDEVPRRVLDAHRQYASVAIDVLVAPVGATLIRAVIPQV